MDEFRKSLVERIAGLKETIKKMKSGKVWMNNKPATKIQIAQQEYFVAGCEVALSDFDYYMKKQ